MATNSSPSIVAFNPASQITTKLDHNNYSVWCHQIETLLEGYECLGYVNGDNPAPAATITADGKRITDPAHTLWKRQDRLIVNLLLASLTKGIAIMIPKTATAQEVWSLLHNMFAKPSRGRILQIRESLNQLNMGTMSISEFIYTIKAKTDELELLGSAMNQEDIIDLVLRKLGTDYAELGRALRVRETPIDLPDLLDKLLNFQVQIGSNSSSRQFSPVTAHAASFRPSPNASSRPQYPNWRTPSPVIPPTNKLPSYQPTNSIISSSENKPTSNYKGKCQLCRVWGHSARYCPQYRIQSNPNQPPAPRPQAHVATASPTASSPPWLLDSGATHHVTTDLNNLALHSPYEGADNILVGDGSPLDITHTGFTDESNYPPWSG